MRSDFNCQEQNIIDFTVVIPTYNGATRLPQVFNGLQDQIKVEAISWEVLVVNNNSTDNTEQVVQKYQSNWPSTSPLRYCFEPRQGLVFAREKAIQNARGELVGFIDDDNRPAPNWVSEAYAFGQTHPKAGAYGSKIKGVFEVEPNENLKGLLFYLALVDRGDCPLKYNPRTIGFPPGAGLVVRRSAWRDFVPNPNRLIGSLGSPKLPCDDYEVLFPIYKAGWEIWYNPNMFIEHLISSNRLEADYFIQLVQRIGLCRHHFRMMCFRPWQRPFAFCLYLGNDVRKALTYFMQHRNALKTDIAAVCEMERLRNTIISPFYLFKLRLDRQLNLFK